MMYTALALTALCAARAHAGGVKSRVLMFHETGPEGSGPMPSSLSLAAHASGPLTATVAQYLNDPIGVQAFSAAAGADQPLWSYWPESVDMDLVWELVGSPAPIAAGEADTVVMQYSNEMFTREDVNCTLWGVSTAPSAAAFKPLWTAKVPHCAPTYQPQNDDNGQWRSLAVTADGSTLVASLVSSDAEVLMGWSLANGSHLYTVPTDGGSYGVALSGDGKWALVASDDGGGGRTAWVYSAATGKKRGASGCRMTWNAVPAISDDGSIVATGDQNGMWLCTWDAASSAYGEAVNVAIPARGQTYWFPAEYSLLTVGGSTFAAGTYSGGAKSNLGRFYAVDAGAVAAGGSDYIVLDALLNDNEQNPCNALVRKAGPYWVVVSTLGIANASAATEYLFAPGTTDAPSVDSPLWTFSGGLIDNVDVAVVAAKGATAATTTLQVLTGGPGVTGNGGQVYWHELVIAEEGRTVARAKKQQQQQQ